MLLPALMLSAPQFFIFMKVVEIKGNRKGALSEAVEEALILWLENMASKLASLLEKIVGLALPHFVERVLTKLSLAVNARLSRLCFG